MQKLLVYRKWSNNSDSNDEDKKLEKELSDGWNVKIVTNVSDYKVHYILEKFTRKDKLEHLRNLE